MDDLLLLVMNLPSFDEKNEFVRFDGVCALDTLQVYQFCACHRHGPFSLSQCRRFTDASRVMSDEI